MIRQNLIITLELFAISLAINSLNMPQNLFFGHEQGRDAAAIEQIYKNHDLRLIGTKTEIEGFFSPPWYYYLMVAPYGATGGNPTAASFFIILLTSITAPIVYLLAKEITKSDLWAALAGLIAALSWEIITYSRWLSNVTLAFPAAALAYYFLYKYVDQKKPKFFLLFAIFASISAQFQVTLSFQFLFVIAALTLLKVIKLPSLKIILLSLFFYALVFSPLILFDFRNQHLITKSLMAYATGDTSFKLNFNFFDSLTTYANQLVTIVARSVFNIQNSFLRILFSLLLLLGVYQYLRDHPWGDRSFAPQDTRKNLIFVATISLMSLGIIIFNVGLTQLYQATAIGWILLVTIALISFSKNRSTRIFTAVLVSLIILGWIQSLRSLLSNDNFFFAPEQNVLRLEDQKALIRFMHQDAEIKPYRFESFTVPYLHSEGWQYLHQYYYPRQESKLSKLVYIAIEKNIPEFWEKKWIEELGESELIFERRFGQIRLQKRIIKG